MKNINESEEMRKLFGKRLRMLREERRLTLQEFVCKLKQEFGISLTFGSIGNYERGYRVPKLLLLNKLADFFDVTTDYLTGYTNVKNAKVIQTSVFDDNNIKHTIKIGIDKNSNLADLSIQEVRDLVLKLKALGIDFDKIIE